jgi:multidrug efflux pump subunit AcrB
MRALNGHQAIKNAELDKDLQVREFRVSLKRDVMKRLSINPSAVASTLRASLQGSSLYEIRGGEEEIKVRITVDQAFRKDMKRLLQVPVENQRGYLVPLASVLEVEEVNSPISITRRQGLRITRVDADIRTNLDPPAGTEITAGGDKSGALGQGQGIKGGDKKNAGQGKRPQARVEGEKPQGKPLMTPLEVADFLEAGVFPEILAMYPSVSLGFDGEIKDTRESKGMMWKALAVVLVLIFGILALLFNSIKRPLVIMLAIPFGAVGVILAFLGHGISEFGLFASIGALGMTGVVVNDAIVMVFKMEKSLQNRRGGDLHRLLADAAQTRLKAVLLTTLTTVAGVMPTAYGIAGYDAMLAQMMMAMAWGLIFGTTITLFLIPCLAALSARAKAAA